MCPPHRPPLNRPQPSPHEGDSAMASETTANKPPWLWIGIGLTLVVLAVAAGIVVPLLKRQEQQPAINAQTGMPDMQDMPPVATRALNPEELKAAEDFGKMLVEKLNTGDADGFDRHFDFDALVTRALSGIQIDPGMRSGLLQGMRSASFSKNLIAQIQAAGGSASFIRVRRFQDADTLLIRLDADGISYFDLNIVPDGRGSFRVTDLYNHGIGSSIVQICRRMAIPLVAEANKSILETLTGSDNAYAKNLDKILEIQNQIRQQNFTGALAKIKALPPDIARDKLLLIIRLQAASRVSPEEAELAIAELEKYYPDDVCLNLLRIDRYFNAEDWESFHACIRVLDTTIGPDAALECLRGNAHLAAVEYKEAEAAGLRALELDPSYSSLYDLLIVVHVRQKKFAKAIEWIETAETNLHFTMGDLSDQPEYADLVKSPEYQAWLAQRAQGQPAPNQPDPD